MRAIRDSPLKRQSFGRRKEQASELLSRRSLLTIFSPDWRTGRTIRRQGDICSFVGVGQRKKKFLSLNLIRPSVRTKRSGASIRHGAHIVTLCLSMALNIQQVITTRKRAASHLFHTCSDSPPPDSRVRLPHKSIDCLTSKSSLITRTLNRSLHGTRTYPSLRRRVPM